MKFITLLAVACAAATPILAQDSTPTRHEQGLMRIDIAGSQRMLSQRVVRNACFVATGQNDGALIPQIHSDIALFDERADTILNGNATLGLAPERSPTVLHIYEGEALVLWQTVRLQALALAARGTAESSDIADFIRPTDIMLDDLDAMIANYEEKYARSSTLSPVQSRTMNIYAAQRMLSQRIAARYCMIGIGLGTPELRQSLDQAFQRFDAAVTDMMSGNSDNRVIAPPAILAPTLACIRDEIEGIRQQVMAATLEQTPTSDEMAQMLQASRTLMQLSQSAVTSLLDTYTGVPAQPETCGSA